MKRLVFRLALLCRSGEPHFNSSQSHPSFDHKTPLSFHQPLSKDNSLFILKHLTSRSERSGFHLKEDTENLKGKNRFRFSRLEEKVNCF